MNYQNKRLFTALREDTIFGIKFYFRSVSTSYFLPKLSRFINKKLYGVGFASALNRYDNSLTLYSSHSDKKLYSDYAATDKFINFGSGAFSTDDGKTMIIPDNQITTSQFKVPKVKILIQSIYAVRT